MKTKDVKFKHSLATLKKEVCIVSLVCDSVKASFDEEQLKCLKDNNQLLLDVCMFVENYVSEKNKHNVSKKDIVVKVISQLFGHDDETLKKVSEFIDFAYENKLIKRDGIYKSILKNIFLVLCTKW